MTVHLVTFNTENMERASWLCVNSSKKHGVETHARYNPANISHLPEVKANPHLFSPHVRSYGYFAWKPLIIKQELARLPEGSILIYSDAGVEFIDNQKYIIDRMDQDVFVFGNMWEHAHWCKRDVVEAIWPFRPNRFAGGDGAHGWEDFGKQCQASVIFFRVSDYSRKFVKEWLDWCLSGVRIGAGVSFGKDNPQHRDERMTWSEFRYLVDDSRSVFANHPEFQENRWDQAILTTLSYREGIRLHWWPAVYNWFVPGGPVFTYEKGDYKDDYPALYHHHRLRDDQWPTHMNGVSAA